MNRSLFSVHLSTAKTWRGGEHQILLLVKGLQARGHRVLVVAPKNSPLLQRCEDCDIPTAAIRFRGSLDPLATLRLISLLRRQRPDLLHVHDGHGLLPGQLAVRAFRRNPPHLVAHRRTIFTPRGRWKDQRLERIIAISQAVRDTLLRSGVPDEKIRVVYSGMEFPAPPSQNEVQTFKAAHGLPQEGILIAHAAALSSEKRQRDMIEVLAVVNEKLKRGRKPSVHLALAGSGDQEAILRAAARDLGVSEQVHFLGFVRDLRPFWASATMACYASEAEGLCTALIEAQGCGLPAVATRAGGMAEVVDDGISGVLTEVGDQQMMAQALLALCEDPRLRLRMGQAAGERMRATFSAESMVEGNLNSYRELCERAQSVTT
ncbi:MAG TPA: glycosyltransferase [Planctomycetota bacterium]|jgi:glycosyltransferase involved in cell wall biosynthesis